MAMRRLGTWLGIAALVLQLGWPLLAGALPRAVALVPLCTVDGVTHYLEVPAGKDPRDIPALHGDHCPLCCTGSTALAGPLPRFAFPERAPAQDLAQQVDFFARSSASQHWARGPPSPVVVTSTTDHGRNDEIALLVGRAGNGAFDGSRILRLGLLHDQH